MKPIVFVKETMVLLLVYMTHTSSYEWKTVISTTVYNTTYAPLAFSPQVVPKYVSINKLQISLH